jgi:hypothetical protein
VHSGHTGHAADAGTCPAVVSVLALKGV